MSDEFNKEATEILHKQIFEALSRIEDQVTYTNGKVKRLTLILVGLGAYVLGMSNIDILSVVKLLV